jgi:hypothetical protein
LWSKVIEGCFGSECYTLKPNKNGVLEIPFKVTFGISSIEVFNLFSHACEILFLLFKTTIQGFIAQRGEP